jgi:hypothetical protein
MAVRYGVESSCKEVSLAMRMQDWKYSPFWEARDQCQDLA